MKSVAILIAVRTVCRRFTVTAQVSDDGQLGNCGSAILSFLFADDSGVISQNPRLLFHDPAGLHATTIERPFVDSRIASP